MDLNQTLSGLWEMLLLKMNNESLPDQSCCFMEKVLLGWRISIPKYHQHPAQISLNAAQGQAEVCDDHQVQWVEVVGCFWMTMMMMSSWQPLLLQHAPSGLQLRVMWSHPSALIPSHWLLKASSTSPSSRSCIGVVLIYDRRGNMPGHICHRTKLAFHCRRLWSNDPHKAVGLLLMHQASSQSRPQSQWTRHHFQTEDSWLVDI